MHLTDRGSREPNRLAHEHSPYLLQHQFNPVDWYPWGDLAFAKACVEDKPIFLSIGYSTCHWCHVMERESFEQTATAEYLNQHFVSIKVDREERPDVDKIYMNFVQATSGGGGWPLNVFLAPDLKPFFGGTYWPPQPRHQRPSFLQVLAQVITAWRTRRVEVVNSAREMYEQLAQVAPRDNTVGIIDRAIITRAGAVLKVGYDPVHGGWGTQPKFPLPSHPAFVLQFGVQTHDDEAVAMVLHTCTRMAAGGINDQLGGGFARYSTDTQWLVPHFEKMLYDNAQLLNLYLDCYLVSGVARYAEVAHSIACFVLRDMTHPAGGFYSAEDADSEGKEGKFYCWTREELVASLTPAEFAVAERAYGITAAGNFLDHSDPAPLLGQNVLSLTAEVTTFEDVPLLATVRAKLLAARARRVRPLCDDKILAGWNGLMLGALARAAAILNEPTYASAAHRALEFARTELWNAAARTLAARWRNGARSTAQLLQAYAYLLSGVIELYQTTLDPDQLEFARLLADSMLDQFYDRALGGFWQSPISDDLILRLKEDHDGAEPSGNSVAILALLQLAAITECADYRAAAEHSLASFAARLDRVPQALTKMLVAADFALAEPLKVVIAGDPNTSAAQALVRAVHAVYRPNRVVLGTVGLVEPFARTLTTIDDRATAYLCTGTACQPPTHDPDSLLRMLRDACPAAN